MERVGGFDGKADQLNSYFAHGGGPDYFAEDLARYTSLTPATCRPPRSSGCPRDRRVELVVEPEATQVSARRGSPRCRPGLLVGRRWPRRSAPDRSKPPALGPAAAL